MADGGETVEALETGVLSIRTDFSVSLFVTGSDDSAFGPALNALQAAVRAAFAADTTLGGAVGRIDYEGSEAPEVDFETGKVAELQLFFVLERGEAELDPYTAA